MFELAAQAAAITVVFVRGSIFDRVRESGPELWQRFARCPLCTGFWIGLSWRLFDAWQLHGWAFHVQTVAVSSFACGAVTAVLAYLLVAATDWMLAVGESHDAFLESLRADPVVAAVHARHRERVQTPVAFPPDEAPTPSRLDTKKLDLDELQALAWKERQRDEDEGGEEG